MGNRAVVALKDSKKSVGVYLHWNGGPESIKAFLEATKILGSRSPGEDPSYFLASFVRVVGNFLGAGGTGIGVDLVENLDCDNWDNGMYILGDGFEVAKRKYARSCATFDSEYYGKVLESVLAANGYEEKREAA